MTKREAREIDIINIERLHPIYSDGAHLPLVFAPESGNMLGGTIVNISGPCFHPWERVVCKFDTESVEGFVVDPNRAICVQPFLFAQGYIRFEVAIGTESFKWKGRYFVGEYDCCGTLNTLNTVCECSVTSMLFMLHITLFKVSGGGICIV